MNLVSYVLFMENMIPDTLFSYIYRYIDYPSIDQGYIDIISGRDSTYSTTGLRCQIG